MWSVRIEELACVEDARTDVDGAQRPAPAARVHERAADVLGREQLEHRLRYQCAPCRCKDEKSTRTYSYIMK